LEDYWATNHYNRTKPEQSQELMQVVLAIFALFVMPVILVAAIVSFFTGAIGPGLGLLTMFCVGVGIVYLGAE